MFTMGTVHSGGSVPTRFSQEFARNPSDRPTRPSRPSRPSFSGWFSGCNSTSVTHSSDKSCNKCPWDMSIKNEPRSSSSTSMFHVFPSKSHLFFLCFGIFVCQLKSWGRGLTARPLVRALRMRVAPGGRGRPDD